MCLDSVYDRNPKKSGFGYKVYRRYNDKLYALFYKSDGTDYSGLNPDNIFEMDKKYKVGILREQYLDYTTKYPLGFHIFKSKEEAKKWRMRTGRTTCNYEPYELVLVKVKYDGAMVEGHDNDTLVVVASKITLTEVIGVF